MCSEDSPRRSPDLNVLDYSLWHAINERMREEEKAVRDAWRGRVPQWRQAGLVLTEEGEAQGRRLRGDGGDQEACGGGAGGGRVRGGRPVG